MISLRKLVTVAITLGALLSGTQVRAEVGMDDKEVVIGNPNTQTGDNAFSGEQTSIGLQACFNAVNAAGGVNGRNIHLVRCDDKYTPDGAASCFEQFQKQGVFAIAGLVGSACLAKYIPMAMSSKMPLVGTYSGPQFVSEPAKRYVFTVRPGYQDEERQFVDHMWNDAGIRKIAIIYQDDAYGMDHLSGLTYALKTHKAVPVAMSSYQRNSTDLTEAFNTIRKADPEAVSLAANHNQCAKIIKMAREANWNPIFFINSGANVDGFIPIVGSAGDGVLVSETVPPVERVDLPLIAKYDKDLKASFPAAKPCYTSLRGYINGIVVVEGLKRAGKDLTREKFVNALDSIHNWNMGLNKGLEVSYNQMDHFGLHTYAFGKLKHGYVLPISNWHNLKSEAAR